MKKILIIFIIPFLFGCEKYDLPTDPKLSGQWVIDAVTFPITNSNQQTILSDTIVVADRKLVNVDGNGVGRFVNNWSDPNIPWHDKFIIGRTVWEFETNLVGLPDRNNSGSPMYRNWDNYFISGDLYERNYKNVLQITSVMPRTYTIVQYGLNTITLKIPKVWTMYRYNGQTYFLREDIRLTLVRI